MIRIGLAAESAADAAAVARLADRVLVERVDWITPEVLDGYRRWCGLHPESYLDVHHAWRLARERRLPVYGHFKGEAGLPEAAMFRAVLLLFAEEDEPPQEVVVARDLDDVPERAKGLEQARQERRWPFEVVAALAKPEIEAWFVAASTPQGSHEAAAHERETARLGFDPVVDSASLTSKNAEDPRDAKRVLRALTEVGRTAEDRMADAALPLLEDRGRRNGLTTFLCELRERFVPLFGARVG